MSARPSLRSWYAPPYEAPLYEPYGGRKEGLVALTPKPGGIAVPLYPPGYSSLPYQREKRKHAKDLPHLDRSASRSQLDRSRLSGTYSAISHRTPTWRSDGPWKPGSVWKPAGKLSPDEIARLVHNQKLAFAKKKLAAAPPAEVLKIEHKPYGWQLPEGERASDEELKEAQQRVRERLITKYGSYRKAFRAMDVDFSGKLDAVEFGRMLQELEVAEVKPATLTELARLCDADGKGVDYSEFTRLVMGAEDAAPLLSEREAREGPKRAKDFGFWMAVDKPPMLRVPLLEPVEAAKNVFQATRAERIRNLEQRGGPLPKWAQRAKDEMDRGVKTVKQAPGTKVIKRESRLMAERVQEALNSRFSDMFLAYKYLDVNNSGYINAAELSRALKLWNLPHTQQQVEDLMDLCDRDSNGEVSYAEFVAALARDTVQVGKTYAERDIKGTGRSAEDVTQVDPSKGVFGVQLAKRLGDRDRVLNAKQGISHVPHARFDVVDATSRQTQLKFTSMFKAFQFADLDNSGHLSRSEIERLLRTFNVPLGEEQIKKIFKACDKNADGEISYDEFVEGLDLGDNPDKVGKTYAERDIKGTGRSAEDVTQVDPSKGVFGVQKAKRVGDRDRVLNVKPDIPQIPHVRS